MTAAEARFNDYDEFARVYARVSETNPYNALYAPDTYQKLSRSPQFVIFSLTAR